MFNSLILLHLLWKITATSHWASLLYQVLYWGLYPIYLHSYYLHKEGIPFPHFISEKSSSEKLIFQGQSTCIQEHWASNLGPWGLCAYPHPQKLYRQKVKQYIIILSSLRDSHRVPFPLPPFWVPGSLLSTRNDKLWIIKAHWALTSGSRSLSTKFNTHIYSSNNLRK